MPARRKKSKTDRIRRAATKAAKSAAKMSAAKTKDAIHFAYKHRKKILDALELIAAVVGTASTVVGKPAKSRRSPKRKR